MRQRRTAQPVFQRSRLSALGELMTEETGRAMERWSGLARAGCRFDVLPELLRLKGGTFVTLESRRG